MGDSPVFVHSLFRSGSTYLFNVFRRSAAGYFCYQEPLHEIAMAACDDPTVLMVEQGENKRSLLRHPQIDAMYFKELYETWQSWKDVLAPAAMYEEYFSPNPVLSIRYFESLIGATKARTVIQECRTSNRIGSLRQGLGGYHIYLWRNPWDQWWSYKVAPYFDAVNRLIVNGPDVPPVVKLFLKSLVPETSPTTNLYESIEWFEAHPLDSEDSYLEFFLLWSLAAREALAHADLLVSIDRLSSDDGYREEILDHLSRAGIEGLDFSDCHIPRTHYLDPDRAFFDPLEKRARDLLVSGGWTGHEIQGVESLRGEVDFPRKPRRDTSRELAGEGARARTVARRFETALAQRANDDAARVKALESLLSKSRDGADQLQVELTQARETIRELNEQLHAASTKVELTNLVAEELKRQGLVAQEEIRRVYGHWVDNALKQQIEAVRETIESDTAARKEIQSLHAEMGRMTAIAEQREARFDAELREALDEAHRWWIANGENEERIRALQSSTAWRLTWPLRRSMEAVKGIVRWALRPGVLTRGAKISLVRWTALRSLAFIEARPALRDRVASYVKRRPRVERLVRSLLRDRGLSVPTPPPAETPDESLAAMTPYSRSIYRRIEALISAKDVD